ncbi:MAG: metal-dependent hydrolase [Firmicutes bacterium]|nr:metal-dependent hydrolase [Bacillota bacterium]
MMKVNFLGHAAFLLEDKGVGLVFDPFLTGNPQATAKPQDLKVDYILVSHAHHDHLGDAVDIARRNGATIVSTAEVAGLCAKQGAQTAAMHIGGRNPFAFGTVRIVQAFHGAGVEGGHACGFIVNFFGHSVYFAGDTGIFGDMELFGRLEPLELALLPIGGNYTMGIDDAVLAAEMLKPKAIIPMHYNTWPVIQANPEEFRQKIQARQAVEVRILAPGQSTEF